MRDAREDGRQQHDGSLQQRERRKVRQDKQSAKATREQTQLSLCAPSSSSGKYYVFLFPAFVRSRVQRKKRFSGLGGANVEIEVTFEGDVVAVLLSVHDGGPWRRGRQKERGKE